MDKWTRDAFLEASEAGDLGRRAELVDGAVYTDLLGWWGGDAAARIIKTLGYYPQGRVSTSTLPTLASLPLPDCWVRRAEAEPSAVDRIGLAEWNPRDVFLVVEVGGDPDINFGPKARLYAEAWYPTYWVVTEEVLFEFSRPANGSYSKREELRRGDRTYLPWADALLSVSDLLR